jgi:glutamyl-tRNA reductase
VFFVFFVFFVGNLRRRLSMKSMIPPSPHLLVIGVNHRTAPLALRETLAFTTEQSARAIEQLRHQHPTTEAVILSTCNRVELYLAADSLPAPNTLTQFLAQFHNLNPDDLAPHLYLHENHAAIQHLFAVTSSLDSMVVGETQILAQVKSAYQHACDANAVGKVLHALFQRALAAAKDVHEKTNLSAGRLSIASVAVELARSVFDRFDDKTVVCIGAGKMATLMLKHLSDLHPKKRIITNRSLPRAQAAANEFNAEARPFEELDQLLTEADILLTSTGADRPIITHAQFKSLQKPRRYRPIVIVDIAVPRDVDSAVADLPNVYLYNIDDLQEVAAGNRTKRDAEITAAKTLLNFHIENFQQWLTAKDVGPLIKALYKQAHAIAKTELEATLQKNPNLTADQRAELERLTHRLIGKLLHTPVTTLTQGAPASPLSPTQLTTAFQQLFNLTDHIHDD